MTTVGAPVCAAVVGFQQGRRGGGAQGAGYTYVQAGHQGSSYVYRMPDKTMGLPISAIARPNVKTMKPTIRYIYNV